MIIEQGRYIPTLESDLLYRLWILGDVNNNLLLKSVTWQKSLDTSDTHTLEALSSALKSNFTKTDLDNSVNYLKYSGFIRKGAANTIYRTFLGESAVEVLNTYQEVLTGFINKLIAQEARNLLGPDSAEAIFPSLFQDNYKLESRPITPFVSQFIQATAELYNANLLEVLSKNSHLTFSITDIDQIIIDQDKSGANIVINPKATTANLQLMHKARLIELSSEHTVKSTNFTTPAALLTNYYLENMTIPYLRAMRLGYVPLLTKDPRI